MKPALQHPVLSVTEKIKKSARSGKSTRFTAAEIEILLRDEIYLAITRFEAEVMRDACARDVDNDNELDGFGSGSGQTLARGAFAGLNADVADLTSRGARRRLSAAMSEAKRPNKQ